MSFTATRSGRQVSLVAALPSDIDIRDIAHHLALINRFAGASEFPVTVAAHSVTVAKLMGTRKASPAMQLAGLLHDAHEAYLGDITSPAQAAIEGDKRGLAQTSHIDEIKASLDDAIYKAFGLFDILNATTLGLIADCDRQAFATEWRFAMKGKCPIDLPPAPFEIREMHWTRAEEMFLKRFEMLSTAAGLDLIHNP